jgi:predicted kinase
MVGVPGAGKSTWLARRRLTAVSTDEIRRWLTDDAADQSANARVFALVRRIVSERLAIGKSVTYVDATNLTRRERSPYRRLAAKHGAQIEAVFFDVPLEVCLARNRQRDRVVPEEAMRRLAAKLEPPTVEEGLAQVIVAGIEQAATEPTAAAPPSP